MDLLSAHHYTQRGMRAPFTPDDARKYEENFLEYSGHVSAGVRRLIDDLRARQDGSQPAIDRIRLWLAVFEPCSYANVDNSVESRLYHIP